MHLVRQADITIALVGEHPSPSGEANSVASIGLPAGQVEVLRVVASNGKPLVVVVFTGRPLDLGEVLDLAEAVLVGWHPGVEAGPALIETLFGDRDPRTSVDDLLPQRRPHSVPARTPAPLADPSTRPTTRRRVATWTHWHGHVWAWGRG